jgi:subtilisin family serine protease
LTILPCDNGKFKPDYGLLNSGTLDNHVQKRKRGGVDISVVSLENMIPSGTIFPGLPTTTAKDVMAALDGDSTTMPDDLSRTSIAGLLAGVTPESFYGNGGPILTIAQRTRDLSSNEICFFDMSNLYYGNSIHRESFFVTDPSLTGSDGKLRMTLRDNGAGGLYRADAEGKHATWSNIGNCLYEEGIAIVKSPILTFFGKDLFEIKCKGDQNVHVSIINIPLKAGTHNSSSNPQFKLLSASNAASDQGEKFVYIDSLCIHDENLNVIARTNFAQPIQKRVDDSMVIRFRMDF